MIRHFEVAVNLKWILSKDKAKVGYTFAFFNRAENITEKSLNHI